jgi:outer membrane lipoprotein LolB
MGATTIHSDGQTLEIHQGDEHRTIDISNPDAIVLNTGWDLPLQALSYWLKGIPAPDSKVQRLEPDPQTELLKSLWQDDWEVNYQRYKQFQGFTLPARLQVQRDKTRAKIIISDWQTSPK